MHVPYDGRLNKVIISTKAKKMVEDVQRFRFKNGSEIVIANGEDGKSKFVGTTVKYMWIDCDYDNDGFDGVGIA